MMGGISDAIALYQQALRICPDFLEVTIKLGTSYLKMHADQLAAQQFNKAIEINDEIVEAYTGLAAAQKLAGQPAEALNTLSLASAIQPNSSFLFAETAKLILKAALEANLLPAPTDGRTLEQSVLAAHERQSARFPNNPDLHYRLGILHMNAVAIPGGGGMFPSRLANQSDVLPGRNETGRLAVRDRRHRGSDRSDHAAAAIRSDDAGSVLPDGAAVLQPGQVRVLGDQPPAGDRQDADRTSVDPATNISIVLQNLGLSDTIGLMWENLCQTAANAAVGKP